MKKGKLPLPLSLRTLLTATLFIALLTASAMFVTVSAADGDAPSDHYTIDKSITTQNVLSIGRRRRNSARLYANASPVSYGSSYGGELTGDTVAQNVYNAFYENFVTTPGNSPFTVSLNPIVTVRGVNNGRTDDQGNTIIDIDETDPAYTNLQRSIARGATAFCLDHPEIFWIRNYSYGISNASVTQTSDDSFEIQINSLSISPNPAYENAYSQRETVNSGIAAARSAIQIGETRYDTLKNIHDYICNNANYDYAAAGLSYATEAHTAAPLFNGKGEFVCEGYSKSLKILCDKFGIPCALVSGTGSNEAHMWAYVKMDDGKWYAVDVTWDDQNSGIIYNYFLKGSNSMSSDHTPSPPVVNNEEVALYYPTLAAEDYDPDWNQGTTPTDPSTSDPSTSDPSTSDPSTSDPSTSDPSTSDPSTSDPSTSDPSTSDPSTSDPSTSDPSTSDPSTSDPSTSDPSTSDPSTSDPSTSDPSTSDPSTSDPSTSDPSTSDPSTSDPSTSANETTSTTQAETKMIDIRIDDPDNGFVKSAQIPETAKAKAGNDDVELTRIRVIVTKLNDAKKKALSDGIRKINKGYDPDNSILEAYDIELVDNNGHTVTITEGKIRICLAFSSKQTKKYTQYVYSLYHQKTEGGVERIKSIKSNAQGVWFEGDKFSPFGLVSVEKSGGDQPSPGTGETILMTVVALILLALAAGAIAFVVIRNKASSDDEEKPEAAPPVPEKTESLEESGAENEGEEKE